MRKVYGIHPVEELLRSEQQVEKIFIRKGIRKESITSILQSAKELAVPIQFVPEEKLKRLTTKLHQGVVALVSEVRYYHTEDVLAQVYDKGELPLLIIADRITDVRNFGAIARTALGVGAHAIIIPQNETASINDDAMKASAGALNILPVCREKNLLQAVKQLKLNGIQLLAAEARGTKFIFETDLKIPTAIIMGAEGEGVTSELLRLADELVKIPMMGKFDSFNVSVATGMILYEAMRQRMTA